MSLSPLPHIGEVTGEATRDDEQRVDTNIVAIPDISRSQPFGGYRHPAKAELIECPCRRRVTAALFYFHERNGPAAASDQVDFAAVYPHALCQDSPAVEPQPPGSKRLRPPTPCFGQLSLQPCSPNASARA